jgi:transcriptional regulator with XRE-family HTH domain
LGYFLVFLNFVVAKLVFICYNFVEVKGMIDVCKRLSQAISDSGLSYADLGEITNIAKSSIQRYATGKTKKIPIEAIQKIAKATNSSAAWILGWEEPDTKQIKEDAVADIFVRLRSDEKFFKATEKLYALNEKQLEAVITMLSTFEQN